jgi:hypothetical protein
VTLIASSSTCCGETARQVWGKRLHRCERAVGCMDLGSRMSLTDPDHNRVTLPPTASGREPSHASPALQ